MSREEIIAKVENQMQHTLDELNKYRNRDNIKVLARMGIAQLDTLFVILDEEWEEYDEWFNKFFEYL